MVFTFFYYFLFFFYFYMVSSELLFYFALHPLSPFEYRNNNILGEIYNFFGL